MRQSVTVACWLIAAFGATVLMLLMGDLIEPEPWTGAAVIAAPPAFFLAGTLTVNDVLRRRGFSDAQIPTAKGSLGRPLLKASVLGLATGVAATVVLYLLSGRP